jgi:hypothetical protein
MHPYMMTTTALEATLYVLYSFDNLDDETRKRRADLARAYHDRTGIYFARRFY